MRRTGQAPRRCRPVNVRLHRKLGPRAMHLPSIHQPPQGASSLLGKSSMSKEALTAEFLDLATQLGATRIVNAP
jgi:hypothetical protein